MDKTLVSVCIPVYNGEKYIATTLESIINQTYRNIEIIVSDNCSTDNSCKIVEEYIKKDSRISLNKNSQNLGYSGNLNKLIEIANGDYVAIYHADDIYEKNIVEEQIKFLTENMDLAGCFTLGKTINEDGKEIKSAFYYNKEIIKTNLIVDLEVFIENMCKVGNMFICPTSIIKKEVYKELNGYRMDLKYIEDQDMWTRILEKYKLGIIAKELFNYRIHGKQGSGYYSSKERQEISVDLLYMKEYLENHNELKIKFENNMNRRISLDYMILAKNAVYLNNYENFYKFIIQSRKTSISKKIKYFILQNMNIKILFHILKLIFINKDREKK